MSDRITYVGHATVRLELGDTILLTDPVLRGRVLHLRRQAPPAPAATMHGVDAVLVSHLHPDHLDFPSLKRAGKGVALFVPAGGGRPLRRRGYRNVIELGPGESARVGEVEVMATRAAHDGRRYPIGPSFEAIGFDLHAPATRAYFAGDTDLFDEMEELAGVDVALLPIGGWGPRVGGDGHLDARGAAEAAAMIRPRILVPIHWGTYMRADLPRRRPELLDAQAKILTGEVARSAPEAEVRVLRPGQTLALPAGRRAAT